MNFLAHSEQEAIQAYKNYWLGDPLWFGVEAPKITAIKVIFNESDHKTYKDDYGTPQEYEQIKIYSIPVEWAVCANITVRAKTLQDAIQFVKNNANDIPLSPEPEYIDGSYRIASEKYDKSSDDIARDLMTYYGKKWACGIIEDNDPAIAKLNKNKEVPSCVDPTYP